MYRRPNAPLPPEVPTAAPGPPTALDPAVSLDTGLRDAISAAEQQVKALLGEERFGQAAGVLADVIFPASVALGAGHPRVRALRKRRAAILLVGGDFRRSLPEFDELAAAYERVEGPDGRNVLNCRRQAADCRAELGHATAALRQYQEVLTLIRDKDGDVSEDALEIRRSIGALLASEGDGQAAWDVLAPLLEDLRLLYGEEHSETQEVARMLGYLRSD
jgi:eukaryotic-like serine/threonine-protein kinase